MRHQEKPVIVVAGGLAGLATAAYLTRAARPVVVLESAISVGGRAATRETKGFFMNLGPHALYAKGLGRSVLDELGVRISGHHPPTSGLVRARSADAAATRCAPSTRRL